MTTLEITEILLIEFRLICMIQSVTAPKNEMGSSIQVYCTIFLFQLYSIIFVMSGPKNHHLISRTSNLSVNIMRKSLNQILLSLSVYHTHKSRCLPRINHAQ